MDDPLEFVAAYVSPLTDKQHAQIGRIAVLWGQIEWLIECLLPRVSGLSWDQLRALNITDRAIGSKVDFLAASARHHKDSRISIPAIEICDAINDTKAQRNHVFHGIWGWRGDDRAKTVTAAARKTSAPHAPFRASQLGLLEKKLCRCSRLCGDLVFMVDDQGMKAKYSRFIHHSGKTSLPKWLEQWSTRNPLDHESLDCNAKANQLPRLNVAFPPK